MSDPLTVPARDCIEAQNGLNDIFPGDPYPVGDQLKRGLDALRAKASRGKITSADVFNLTDPLMDILSRCEVQPVATPAPSQDAAVVATPEPFIVGNRYRTVGGDLVRLVEVHRAGTMYETMTDEEGVHRYTSRDFGRGTGTDHHKPDPRNIIPLYTRPAEAQVVAEGWKPTELHIVFKDEGGPSNLRFIEVETIDGRSVRAGTWLKRDGYDILALSVHLSDVALAASPATGGA